MIGLIWNCRGVTKKGMSSCLKDLLYTYHVDFVGLQETIKKNYSENFFRKVDPGKSFAWHWIPSVGRSGGVLCGINSENFDIISVNIGTFAVKAIVLDKKLNKKVCWVTVYGPPHDDKKEEFLTEMASLCSDQSLPLLIGGDFNILRFSSEKNKTFRGNKFTDMFNLIINSHDLREISMSGGKYTWSNNQADPTLERLDRILINEKWELQFPLTNLRKIPRFLSDHNPLILCTEQEQATKKKAFCFETSWLKHHDFLPKIHEIWGKHIQGKNAIETWIIKIKRVKKFLKGWGQSLRGHTRKFKQILQEELLELEKMEETNTLPSSLLARKTFIQTELLKIQEDEEMYWHKRSNSEWLLRGDNNTNFFHRVANGKKRKNTIFSIQENGKTIEREEEILDHATQYYRNLFGPSASPITNLDPNCWSPEEMVEPHENEILSQSFSEEEIKKAVMTMEKNTAPGPDHMPIEFFQACWSIIKDDILMMFADFSNHNLDIGRLNYGTISLIPKVKEANIIQQYRSICLLNVIYKIFTKALMLRVENVLERIINRSQTAFLKGRNIMDGVMCLHEILHDTKARKKDGIILKLDFEKAYDKINWDFIMECLKQRGFCEKWCKWIWEVMTSGTLSVKVNSGLGSYFKCGKGVRQGDPLSPLLFNLAANVLAKMVNTAQQNGIISGLVPEYVTGGIAILQYTDDTILCLKDDEAVARNTKLLLYHFENMSGLKINFNKSEIVMVSEEEQKSLHYSDLFNCATSCWPIKYLGVPVSGSRLHIMDWLPLDEKLLKRLDGWKGNTLSFGAG